MFTLNQSIALGITCSELKYIRNFVMVYGISSEIKFYQFSGSAYTPSFTLNTSEIRIYEVSIYDGGQKFMLGGFSQSISTYALSGGSYGLEEQFETGGSAYRLFVDSKQLYFILALSTPTIEILFRCP